MWLPLAPGLGLFLNLAFDLLTVKFGLRWCEPTAQPRHHLDAFNRMRIEFAIGKISNSVNHFSDGFPEQWKAFADNEPLTVSSAVLESRIVLRRLPTSGEGYVIRSGLKSATDKVRTLVHWAFDPVSGKPLWSMEAVACMLNLQTRKLEPATPDMLSTLQSKVKSELAV